MGLDNNVVNMPKLKTGVYHFQFAPAGYGTLTTSALTADRLYAIPTYIPKAVTIDRIAIYITGAAAAGKKISFGLYRADGSNLYPGTQITTIKSGEKSADGTGLIETALGSPITISPGFYYYGLLSDGAPTLRACQSILSLDGIIVADWSNYIKLLSVAYVYVNGFLPSPFEGGAAADAGIFPPMVGLRLSAG